MAKHETVEKGRVVKTEKKALISIELKSGDGVPEGSFRAIFSRFNVIDHDGDVTLPTAFQDVKGKRVPIQGTGHNWDVPSMGYGQIDYDSEKAWVDGRLNLKMQSAKELYESIKFAHENGVDQQYSYAYDVKGKAQELLPEYPGAKRVLSVLDPKEISPVLLGAGIGTGTMDVKAKKGSFTELKEAYPWDKCIADQKAKGYSDESAHNICGWIRSHKAFKQAELSDEDKRSLIQDAVRMRSQMDDLEDGEEVQTWGGPYIMSTYDDYVIVCDDEEYFKVPYTIDENGDVTLGDQTPVEQVWMEKSGDLAALKYADHAEKVLATFKTFSDRSKSLADLRAKVGRQLSAANREKIKQTADAARAAAAELEALLTETDASSDEKGRIPASVIKARLAAFRLQSESLSVPAE